MAGPLRQFEVTLELDKPNPAAAARDVSAVDGDRAQGGQRPAASAADRVREGRPADRLRADRRPGSSRSDIKVLHRTESRVAIDGCPEGAEIALISPEASGRRPPRSRRRRHRAGMATMTEPVIGQTASRHPSGADAGIRQPARAQAPLHPYDAGHDLRRGGRHRHAFDRRRRPAAGHCVHRAARRAQRHCRGARSRRLSGASRTSACCRPACRSATCASIRGQPVGGINAISARKRFVPTKALPKPQGDMPAVFGVAADLSGTHRRPSACARPVLHARRRKRARRPWRCSDSRPRPDFSAARIPIGRYVKLNEQWFRVVGVASPRLALQGDVGGMPAQDSNNVVYVPISSAILRMEDAQSYHARRDRRHVHQFGDRRSGPRRRSAHPRPAEY